MSLPKLKTIEIIWIVIVWHLACAVTIATTRAADGVTAIHDALLVFPSRSLMIFALVVASIGSVISMTNAIESSDIENKGFILTLLLLPQQALVVLTMLGGLTAIFTAQFADGVIRPRAFLLIDQSPIILLGLGHSWAMLKHCLDLRR